MRKVGFATGLEWLREAFTLLRAHALVFLTMSAIMIAVALIPLLGSLVLLILGPALFAGMVHAASEAAQGRTPRVGQLFQAFQDGDRVGSLIALCLPVVAAGLIFVIAAAGPIGTAVTSGALTPETLLDMDALEAALGGTLMSLALLMLVLGLLVGMMGFFAVAAVMIGKEGGFRAMRLSLLACLRNFGAFFVAVFLLGLAVQVLRAALSLVMPALLAGMLSNIPYYAILGPLMYVAYRSVFGPPPAAEAQADRPPPSPPPMFEA